MGMTRTTDLPDLKRGTRFVLRDGTRTRFAGKEDNCIRHTRGRSRTNIYNYADGRFRLDGTPHANDIVRVIRRDDSDAVWLLSLVPSKDWDFRYKRFCRIARRLNGGRKLAER
jgi:hypothetical protein